jgi:hypothetical protein
VHLHWLYVLRMGKFTSVKVFDKISESKSFDLDNSAKFLLSTRCNSLTIVYPSVKTANNRRELKNRQGLR